MDSTTTRRHRHPRPAPTQSPGGGADQKVAGSRETLGYTAGPDAQPDVVSVTLTPSATIRGPLNSGAFVGYAGFFSAGPDRHVVETGLMFGAASDLQIDANWGIDIDTGDYVVGIGFARRWGWRSPETDGADPR